MLISGPFILIPEKTETAKYFYFFWFEADNEVNIWDDNLLSITYGV